MEAPKAYMHNIMIMYMRCLLRLFALIWLADYDWEAI